MVKRSATKFTTEAIWPQKFNNYRKLDARNFDPVLLAKKGKDELHVGSNKFGKQRVLLFHGKDHSC